MMVQILWMYGVLYKRNVYYLSCPLRSPIPSSPEWFSDDGLRQILWLLSDDVIDKVLGDESTVDAPHAFLQDEYRTIRVRMRPTTMRFEDVGRWFGVGEVRESLRRQIHGC